MTLPSSGTMTANMINVELGRSGTAVFDINGTPERTLAEKPSGIIKFSDFYGKSNLKPAQATHFDSISGSDYVDTAPGAITHSIVKTAGSSFNTSSPTKFGGNNYFSASAPQQVGLYPYTLYNLNELYWTLELWTYEITGSLGSILSSRSGTAVGWCWTTSGLRAKINGTWSETQMTWTQPSLSNWHYMTLVRAGSELRMFVDGTRVATKTGVSTIDQPSLNVYMGNARSDGGTENLFKGYVDDYQFYISNTNAACARYNANFTPPTAPF